MVAPDRIRELSDSIARTFKPERIMLFGSQAYGAPEPHSDVDLLVILDFKGSPFRKLLEILNHVNPNFGVDLLARRPDDTQRRYRECDPLIREALDRGVMLYKRNG